MHIAYQLCIPTCNSPVQQKDLLVLDVYCYIFYMQPTSGLSAPVTTNSILGQFLLTTFFQIPAKEVSRGTYVWGGNMRKICPSKTCLWLTTACFHYPIFILTHKCHLCFWTSANIWKHTSLRIYLQISILLMCCRIYQIMHVKMHQTIRTSFYDSIYFYIFDTLICDSSLIAWKV